MKVEGQCHCGYLVFEAEVDPETVEVCHCEDCQTLQGSAFSVVVPAKPGTFRQIAGEPTIYIKTAESGNRRKLAFCPRCGSRMFSAPADSGSSFFGLRVGALKQRDQLIPRKQYWMRSAQAWTQHMVNLPAEEQE
jgi:hypothetical protein